MDQLEGWAQNLSPACQKRLVKPAGPMHCTRFVTPGTTHTHTQITEREFMNGKRNII